MRIIAWERIGDRRVRLVVDADASYLVTIEVLGPDEAWHDISLLADVSLHKTEATRRYTYRVAEQRHRLSLFDPIPVDV